jgi:hypothetical protein
MYKRNVPTTWQVSTSDKKLLNMPVVKTRLTPMDFDRRICFKSQRNTKSKNRVLLSHVFLYYYQ